MFTYYTFKITTIFPRGQLVKEYTLMSEPNNIVYPVNQMPNVASRD